MKKGFVFVILTALLLCLIPTAFAADFEPVSLTAEQNYAMNLFLSNFTETGVDRVDSFTDHDALAIFGHHHLWCNDYEAFEYGEYFNDNNCRISSDRVLETINNYFYYENSGAEYLNQDIFDEDDEYYYHCETGGWSDYGFAYVTSVCPIGDDKYFVSFLNFCNAQPWENDVLNDALDAIIQEYGTPISYGSALIHTDDLANRNSYKMISYSLV